MIKFSIIIPIYNRATFLEQSLKSVLEQTYKNIEVVCVNDCSSDKSLELLTEHSKNDIRIKIVNHEKNLGTHMARKSGVENATGDYILFLDCDDSLVSTACEVLQKELLNNPTEVVEFAYTANQGGKPSLPYKNITIDNFFSSLVYPKHVRAGTIWNKVYKAELVKKAFSKTSDVYSIMGEDYFESVVIAYYVKSYTQINDVLYYYLHNEIESACFKKKTVQQIKKDLTSIQANLKAFDTFFSEHAPEHKKTLSNIERFFVNYLYYSQILKNVKKSEWKACFKMLSEYFSEKALLPYKRKMNSPLLFVELDYAMTKFVAFIKSLFPRSFKNRIKKLLGRN